MKKITEQYGAFLGLGMLLVLHSTLSFSQVTVYDYDFDDLSVGQYDEETLEDAIDDINFCNGADEGRVHVSSVGGHGNVLDVKYPEGGMKTGGSGINTKWFFNDNGSYEELYFSYSLYIPADFEWATGGKLPGLGYQTSDRNMSLRLMWREEGLLEFYVHYNTNPDDPLYQSSINWSLLNPYDYNGGPGEDQVKLKKGQWNDIKMYYKLNTPGQSDGIMKGWLNGNLAIDIDDNSDMRTINEGDIKLNCMYFSAFFGTSVPSPVNTYMYFDDLLVTTGDFSQPDGYPDVSITSPISMSTIDTGDDIVILADAFDADGDVQIVKFYKDDILVGEDASYPYRCIIQSASAGSYTLTAEVFDDDGLSSTSSEVYISVVDDNEEACSFAPMANALPSLNTSFDNVYVIGDGPDLSSIRKFSINWNQTYNGLYVFAFNTKNGSPSWYVNMLDGLTHSFNNSQPSVSISGSGIPGIDGDYYAIIDGDNFVLDEHSGAYTLYFSNSAVPPSCESLKSATAVGNNLLNSVIVYPNPVSEGVVLVSGMTDAGAEVSVTDIEGRVLYHKKVSRKYFAIDVNDFKSGCYMLRIKSKNCQIIKKINKL